MTSLLIDLHFSYNLKRNRMKTTYLLLVISFIFGKQAMAENINDINHQDSQEESIAPNDFDFELGTWKVKHRRLRNMFSDKKEWLEFEGSSSTTKILGGYGNLEDNVLHFPDNSFRAVAIRSYDSATKKWSIWWLDGRSPNKLDAPVIGSFKNKVGLFYAEEVLNGIQTKIRFKWDSSKQENPKWEQAFSFDDGVTWETNWTMSFSPAN